MDRERVAELVGKKVAVGLDNGEPGSVGIVAKLEEVRDDGILLSEMSELGPGPTMFYPGDSLKQYSQWMPWLGMPRERRLPGETPQEYYELYEWREKPAEEVASEPPQRDRPSARWLDRIVPTAQRRKAGEAVVALTSLDLFGEGVGVLR